MDCWINKEDLKIREGKSRELWSFLHEKLYGMKEGSADHKEASIEELLRLYLDMDDVYFEDDHICLIGKGIYDQSTWESLSPYLEGYVEQADIDGVFRDVFEDGSYRCIMPTILWENEPVHVPNLKKYFVYMDDGRDAFRVAVPAINRRSAEEYVKGNGEIIAVKDVTDTYHIGLGKVREALTAGGFGEAETDLIVRVLNFTGVAE